MGQSLPGAVGFGCAWQALGARSLGYFLGGGLWVWGLSRAKDRGDGVGVTEGCCGLMVLWLAL